MKSVAADIGILVDTRGVHGKRVLEDAVLHMLGSRYRVWSHSDESVKKESLMQRVGGVAFVVGPRVSQVKLDRLCKQGSSAAISCSLGAAKLYVMAGHRKTTTQVLCGPASRHMPDWTPSWQGT